MLIVGVTPRSSIPLPLTLYFFLVKVPLHISPLFDVTRVISGS